MPRKIHIFDTTLRDGEQSPGCSMNLDEKLEIATHLVQMGVDAIEAGFAIASPGDFESVKAIADRIKDCTVVSLSRAVEKDIDASWEALRNAVSPRIHTFIATSPIHMQYKLKISPDNVLDRVSAMVAYARKYVGDVEFSAEDATRSGWDFLVKVFERALQSGATVINIPDTVGYTTPDEMYNLVKYICDNTKGIEKATISVHCHDDLGMSVANTLAAIRAGATQAECTINGIGERAGNAALEEIVMALYTRAAHFGVYTDIDTKMIYRASKLIQGITGVKVPPNKAIVGANAFAHESGIHQHGVLAEKSTYEIMTPESVGISKNRIVLGKHSGRHALEEYLKNAGYRLSEEQISSIFKKFKELADRKKTVVEQDIEAIVGNREVNANDKYQLVNYVINSGNDITSTAIVKMICDGTTVEKVAIGDGPVDAAIKAINLAVGEDITLTDYSLHSVSEGHDAQGEAMVRLSYKDEEASGRGLSTDIIEASIKAYLNGINRIMQYIGKSSEGEKQEERQEGVV